ncbi:hypothetical protein [Polyangium aurulentum]|uniref:hypothetical protein n=1 Tax=Polyangium aurulentum TaxID=2567896 RepID=UPI0010ADD3DA|nr:hypothetical protein [Polyangium aurulentum]UQA55176.1 hypothetical protein E8A73_027955 [Polyangium aurulentum]
MTSPLAQLKQSYLAATIPAVTIPGVLSLEAAEEIRARLAGGDFEPFFLAHRGRYARNASYADEELFEGLVALAQEVTGEPLRVAAFRWMRLVRGDYALMRDDPAPLDRHTELTLDVSGDVTGAAEICYAHRGRLFHAVSQLPGAVGLVQRGPTIRRYDRYLNHAVRDAEIVRLTLTLMFEGA